MNVGCKQNNSAIPQTEVADEAEKQALEYLQSVNAKVSENVIGEGIHVDAISAQISKADDFQKFVNELSKLRNLRYLELTYRSDIGDEQLAKLAVLTQLHRISLGGTGITDDGLRHLPKLSQLRHIGLNATSTGDTGLEALSTMPQLESLHVRGTKVTDDGLKYIGKLVNLKRLELGATAITDEGLKNLAPLKHIVAIWLDDTKITGGGLLELVGMKELKEMGLTYDQSRKFDEIRILKMALPGLYIRNY